MTRDMKDTEKTMAKKGSQAIRKSKICDFTRSALGGYNFTYVYYRERDDLGTGHDGESYHYYFEADAMCFGIDGRFVSGAFLTYGPLKTIADANRRWNEFPAGYVECDDDIELEDLVAQAIKQYNKYRAF